MHHRPEGWYAVGHTFTGRKDPNRRGCMLFDSTFFIDFVQLILRHLLYPRSLVLVLQLYKPAPVHDLISATITVVI